MNRLMAIDPLLEPGFDGFPLGGRNNAGDNIDRENAFGAIFITVNVKSYSHLQQRRFRRFLQR